MELSTQLLKVLVCPVTKGPLEYDRNAQELISELAGLAYPVKNGIPILLVSEARKINKNAYKPIPTKIDYINASDKDFTSQDNSSQESLSQEEIA
jgi:uncharacterized protein YbaR (Trm112 family)